VPYRGHVEQLLIEALLREIETRRYSRRTAGAYSRWVRRFLRFHRDVPPESLGKDHVTAFLSDLATEKRVSASAQNQALSAIAFLFRHVLRTPLPWLDEIVRAKRSQRVPVVLSRDEVRRVLGHLEGVPFLVATLLYGAGLRLLECCRLRVKDVDFYRGEITVRGGKGDKDRVTMLPLAARSPLIQHLDAARVRYDRDVRDGAGWVELPHRLADKYPAAAREWRWAVGLHRRAHVRPHRIRPPAAAPLPRVGRAARLPPGRPRGRRREAGHLPHPAPQLRHPPARGRPRHPHGAGATRPLRRLDDDDLHPRAQPASQRRAEPRGPAVSAKVQKGRVALTAADCVSTTL
jgi:integrase